MMLSVVAFGFMGGGYRVAPRQRWSQKSFIQLNPMDWQCSCSFACWSLL